MIVTVGTGVLESVRVDMFSKLEKLPLKYFDSQTHGEIMSRFSPTIRTRCGTCSARVCPS